MTGAPYQTALKALTADGPPRVWSLIVTLFGDLGQGKDARLSGTLLNRLMAQLDIRPEALRVALHRLRRDGWIDSAKSGREGQYFLTGTGRAQSRRATPLIYGPDPSPPMDWHLVIAGPGGGLNALMEDERVLPVGPAAALVPGPAPDAPDLAVVRVRGMTAPDWLTQAIWPADLRAAAQHLKAALAPARTAAEAGLPPLETAALRMLVVHEWRRIALRTPVAPPDLVPPDWQGPACRTQVLAILGALPAPPLPALEAAAREA